MLNINIKEIAGNSQQENPDTAPFQWVCNDQSIYKVKPRFVQLQFGENAVESKYNVVPEDADPITVKEMFGDEVVVDHVPFNKFHIVERFLLHNIPVRVGEKKEQAINWLIDNYFKAEIEDKPTMLDKLSHLVAHERSPIKREEFINVLSKAGGFTKKVIRQQIEEHQSYIDNVGGKNSSIPDNVNSEEFHKFGFYEDTREEEFGIHFDGERHLHCTNFLIEPLFHVFSQEDNKRLVKIRNQWEEKVIEMASSDMISLDRFMGTIYEKGNFLFFGSKIHLLKILNKIGYEFPKCYELKTLGWQPEGFFAYYNSIYNGKLENYNEYGIVEHKSKKYYSPSISKITEELRDGENPYENDRYLQYTPAPVEWEHWMKLFTQVYGNQKGMLGIGFIFMSLFKDIVFKLENTFPFLYAYGQVQSGKSSYGDSISNCFFNDMKPFNLNQGTDFAFFNRLGRFRNCPVVLNEFDEEMINPTWFRAIKGAYDGQGRERGRGGKGNKTETQAINCSILLLGQYLSTKDDGSVLSRSIIVEFQQTANRSDKQTELHAKLKQLEKEGLGGIITEVMKYRDIVDKKYQSEFGENLKTLKMALNAESLGFKERIIRNYCALFTIVKILYDEMRFPFMIVDMEKFIIHEVARLSQLLDESNALADFWNTLVYMVDNKQLEEGFHYKIECLQEIKINVGRDKSERKQFAKPKKLLFLRLNSIHKLYAEAHRRQTGKNGLNQKTIEMYINSEKAFIGNNPSSQFKSRDNRVSNTSSFVFDYDKLAIDMEREVQEEKEITTLEKQIVTNAVVKSYNNGKPILIISLVQMVEEIKSGITIQKELWTRCESSEIERVSEFKTGTRVNATGELIIKNNPDGAQWRTLAATKIEIVDIVENVDEINNLQDELPF
jgi:hypothetical protein